METDQILNYIYENAKMGKESTKTLIKSLEGKENKLIEAAEDILKSYADFENKAKELIATTELKEPKLIAKISANMGIQCEVLKVDKILLLSKVKTFLRNINNGFPINNAVETFLKSF